MELHLYRLLKDFQPTFAALIALAAAALAYRAAVSRIQFDRDNLAREHERQKLALCSRIRHEAVQIRIWIGRAAGKADLLHSAVYSDDAKETAEIVLRPLKSTPALDEAWLKLYQFPPALARKIERLQGAKAGALILFEEAMKPLDSKPNEELPGFLNGITSLAKEIEEDLTVLIGSTKV